VIVLHATRRAGFRSPAVLLAAFLRLAPATPAAAAEPAGARVDPAADCRFPPTAFVLDVTKPPYSAKGDGVADDTAALRRAIHDANGAHKVVYLPNGTYLVSETLAWTNRGPDGKPNWGFTWVQGQNPAKCVLRLKDGTFTDPKAPKAVMWCGGFGSADWFHNYVQGLTVDTGRGNPGAVGLQFYSNNTGAVRDCLIRSGDGAGVAGLDLGHRDMNGPLLVRNVEVRGFRVGVTTARAANGQTIEHVTLSGQTEFGLDNHGQALAVRGLVSDGSGVAVRSYGTLALLDATLTGRGGGANLPAVANYNGGRVCLRDVATTGYGRAVADVATPDLGAALRVGGDDKPGSRGPRVAEYFSHLPTSPFGGPARSPRLPVAEPPVVPWDDPTTWAVAEAFGADPTGQRDSSAAIQRAIDSGATTVFLPGFYAVQSPVRVRGNVRRLVGTGGWIDYAGKSKPDLVIEDGTGPVVLEHFANVNGGVGVNTTRPIVFRSVGVPTIRVQKARELFFEDVTTDDLRLPPGVRAWARQLNVENEGTHVTNDGAKLWVLGYKTERGGTLLHTKNGGASEVFGTLSYTTTKGKFAPMFVTEDAAAFAFLAEVCYTGDPFSVLVRESRGGVVREVRRGAGDVVPYIGRAAE
jgi:hypothetical protein